MRIGQRRVQGRANKLKQLVLRGVNLRVHLLKQCEVFGDFFRKRRDRVGEMCYAGEDVDGLVLANGARHSSVARQ